MSFRERFRFYLRLGDLLRSGVPLRRALEGLAGGRSKATKRLAGAGIQAIDAGGRISDGFAAGGCPELERSVLRLAEETGALGDGCRQLADYYEFRLRVRDLWMQGLTPPLVALVILVLALLGAGYALHGLQVALARLLYGLVATTAFAAFALAGTALVATVPALGRAVSRFSLSLPFFGGILLGLARARFTLFLSQLYASGQVPATCLELAADACGNAHLQRRLRRRAQQLIGGGSLSSALASESILDEGGLEVLCSAEEAGTVDSALAQISRRYREEAQAALEQRLPVLARLILIPIVVALFFIGLLDVALTLLGRLFELLGGQISGIELPSFQ